MKLIPHNKSVGVIFFLVLIAVALFLFISDFFGGKNAAKYKEGGSIAHEASSATQAGNSNSSLPFGQANWQDSLVAVGAEAGDMATAGSGYNPATLKITAYPTAADLKQYVADLKYALRKYADPKFPSEVNIMMKAYEAKSESGLSLIAGIAKIHESTVAELLAMKVPANVAVYHTDIMNSLKQLVKLDGFMQNIFTQTDLATISATSYLKEAEKVYSALSKIDAVISNRGVIIPTKDKITIYLGASTAN